MRVDPKICTRDRLLAWRTEARAAGQRVVHCHGCFDIVHPGHIHHLQYARSLGDLLVVSVSADAQVNKGLDRPLIPDDLRAASLAALECVDRVHLNYDATAVGLLEDLQPDIYVKGREYEQNFDPRFVAERETVTRHGGRVVFSSGDIVYSSTALIGTLRKSEFEEEKSHRFCERYGLDIPSLARVVEQFRGQRVMVVGDYMLDRYHFCDATGVAGEGPMMALRKIDSRDFDGGAAVIALHLRGLGADPTLFTSLADDELSASVELRMRWAGVRLETLHQQPRCIVKHRYLVDETKLFKVDDGSVAPLDSQAEAELADRILAHAHEYSAVIFADFGYGLLTAGLLDRILPRLRDCVPVLTADVSGKQGNLLRFTGVDLLCPTEREVRETLHDFTSGLGAVVSNLLQANNARQAIITLGKQGLVTCDWPGGNAKASDNRLRSEYLPAFSARSVDPLGCGDSLLATASLTLASGGSLQAAALLGSLAAAVQVQSLGNVPLTREALMGMIHRRQMVLERPNTASRLAG
ncbi:MAG: adenylyltransferase/cytidyltransferase family protein [Phycisphaerae bacterium]|nr:adenylyltransferase/cytidyltransferase family protein [Phycisphaerae bacterium]